MHACCRRVASVVLLATGLMVGGCSNGTSPTSQGSAPSTNVSSRPASTPTADATVVSSPAASTAATSKAKALTASETCDEISYLLNQSELVATATSVTDLQQGLNFVVGGIGDSPPLSKTAASIKPVLARYAKSAAVLNAAAQPFPTLRAFETKVAATPSLLAAGRTVTSSPRQLASWYKTHC